MLRNLDKGSRGPRNQAIPEEGATMNEQQLEKLRSYYDNTDTSDFMEDAQPGDLGTVADPEASVASTVTMANRVLRAARGIAAAEGVSTNDVLRRFIQAGVGGQRNFLRS